MTTTNPTTPPLKQITYNEDDRLWAALIHGLPIGFAPTRLQAEHAADAAIDDMLHGYGYDTADLAPHDAADLLAHHITQHAGQPATPTAHTPSIAPSSPSPTPNDPAVLSDGDAFASTLHEALEWANHVVDVITAVNGDSIVGANARFFTVGRELSSDGPRAQRQLGCTLAVASLLHASDAAVAVLLRAMLTSLHAHLTHDFPLIWKGRVILSPADTPA